MADNAEGPANSRPEIPAGRGAAPPLAPEPWRPHANIWVIGVVVAMAAFMEVLDTSIANVALPYMAGNLGASNDESTWVLTSYLVSNAIVLPISGWFASVLGRKRFFMMCLVIFTLSSLLCGIAPSLGAIILFRVLQGAGGGGLQPMAQAILADTFPPRLRGVAFALYGITTIVAPTIGPTLGGWITDNYTWRWIFFINLPVGIVALFLVYRLIEDPPWVKRAQGCGGKDRLYRRGAARSRRGRLAGDARQGAGGRLVRVAFHSYACRRCRRMPRFTRHLGMVLQDPDHRSAPLQESELPRRQRDDVHSGDHAFLQPRHDAPVPSDAHGLHGRVGGPRAFRRRLAAAVPDARGGDARRPRSRRATSSLLAGSCFPFPCTTPPSISTSI